MKTYKIYYCKIVEGKEFPGTTILTACSLEHARRRFFRSVADFDYDFSISNIEVI
jgi:hypothetical protein